MKAIATLLLPLLPLLPLATAQLLSDQTNGALPSCGSSCTVLTQAQSACNGANSQSITAWECFCKQVWSASGGALTTMCATSCTSASDNAAIDTWYTANCGSDNGASEHSGSGTSNGNGNGNNGGTSTTAGSSATSSSSSGSSSNSGNDGYSGGSQCTGSWFHCHWQWIVMVIVLAIALTALGVGGRYWKKRHDRKRDAAGISAFNPGITTRSAGANPYPSQQPPPSASAPMSQVHDPSFVASGDINEVGRNSPSRTREAFMPYGYGYTRSESRLGGAGSGIPRGATPVNEMEKGGSGAGGDGKRKSRRVLVRERSGDGE